MRRNILKETSPFRIIKRHSGFTLIELTVALILLGVLILIAISVYTNQLNKAKVTVAESALHNARENLTLYNIDNSKYPDSVDFTDCIDERGKVVFSAGCCEQLNKDLSAIEYQAQPNGYIITARAKDNRQTLLTLTPANISKQEN